MLIIVNEVQFRIHDMKLTDRAYNEITDIMVREFPETGYKVTCIDDVITLEESDNPFTAYWANCVFAHIARLAGIDEDRIQSFMSEA